MHDTDHSKEHVRAAAKVGDGPETNKLSALDAVQKECNSLARSQGGTSDNVDYDAAVAKGRNDIDTQSSERTNENDPQGHRYHERIPRGQSYGY